MRRFPAKAVYMISSPFWSAMVENYIQAKYETQYHPDKIQSAGPNHSRFAAHTTFPAALRDALSDVRL
jgi:hypothetical protein